MHKDILAILADYATYHVTLRLMPDNKQITRYNGYDIDDHDRMIIYNNKMMIYNRYKTYRLCYKTNKIIMEYIYINNNIYNTYIDINDAITYYKPNSVFISLDELHIHITIDEDKVEIQIVLYYDIDNLYLKYYDISDEFRELSRKIFARYYYYQSMYGWPTN